jgi:hypothetical protein
MHSPERTPGCASPAGPLSVKVSGDPRSLSCSVRHLSASESLGLDGMNFAVLRRSHSTLHEEIGTDTKIIADQQGHALGVHLDKYIASSMVRKQGAVASKTFRASSLNDPVFDIHYNARRGGASDRGAKPIPYALVLTVETRHIQDLYNKIALRYPTQLEELRPVIQIPIRISPSSR